MNSSIKHTSVFFKNLAAYRQGYRYIINQGSSRSSKTYSILQLLWYIAHKPQKRVISVVSSTLPHLKRGALRDFVNFLTEAGEYDERYFNKSDLIFQINNSIIEFFSVDQAGKVYGAGRDILFVNEVNRIDEEIFRQLVIRTRERVFVDYNPTHEFYIITDYKQRENAKYIHSTYRDNPYLNKEIVLELEAAGQRNENFRKVFLEGELGVVEGTIFNNWEFGEFDESLPVIFGQDYGFVNDPTTLVRVAVDEKRKRIYVDECYYKEGLTTDQIYSLNSQYAGSNLIVADSAEPRLINELRGRGLNIVECIKGQDSVKTGLITLQDYLMIVTEKSRNIERELRNYVWLDSKNIPIDAYNHTIDAIRYAVMYKRHKTVAIA